MNDDNKPRPAALDEIEKRLAACEDQLATRADTSRHIDAGGAR